MKMINYYMKHILLVWSGDMKLNNKGITLTEIIISIALISIVLLFLFSLLVTVNDINKESEVNSTYLINKSLILKNIEEDLRKVESNTGITLSTCNVNEIYSKFDKNLLNIENQASECIKIGFNDGTYSYLGIYYYDNRKSYVISYIHDNIKATRLLPGFEIFNVNKSTGNLKENIKMKIKLSNGNICGENLSGCSSINSGFSTITIPIIGSDEKDYSIIVSYYGKISVE